MLNPVVDQLYYFVAVRNGEIRQVEFKRSADGGVLIVGDDLDIFIGLYEQAPDVWQKALSDLEEMGYTEFSEAKRLGLIPTDWVPKQSAWW